MRDKARGVVYCILPTKPVLWIRIRKDPKILQDPDPYLEVIDPDPKLDLKSSNKLAFYNYDIKNTLI
jgi:hypothetical protein